MSFVCVLLLGICASVALAQNQPPPRTAASPATTAPAQPATPTPRFWRTVTSTEGGYSVEMPDAPVDRRMDVKNAKGQVVPTYLQEVGLDGGQTYFGMVWTRSPPLTDAKAIEKRLNEVRDGTRAALQGTLITTRPIRYRSVQGLDYVIESGPKANRFRYRLFLVGDRLIQQVYSGPTGSENSPDVRKFHDSLKLN